MSCLGTEIVYAGTDMTCAGTEMIYDFLHITPFVRIILLIVFSLFTLMLGVIHVLFVRVGFRLFCAYSCP